VQPICKDYASYDQVSWWALLNLVLYLWVPSNAGSFLTSWESVRFSRRTMFHGGSK